MEYMSLMQSPFFVQIKLKALSCNWSPLFKLQRYDKEEL